MGFTEDANKAAEAIQAEYNQKYEASGFEAECFERGAKWAQDKGLNYLTEWMSSTARKRGERLEKVIRFAAGLISTMDQFKDQHPEQVEQWIYTEALKD